MRSTPLVIDTPAQLDQLVQRDAEGRVTYGVGLRLTLYFADAYTPTVREGVLACVYDYLQETASMQRRCSVPWSRRWVPFGPQVGDDLRAWLEGADADTPWDFVATGAADDREASPFHLELLATPAWQARLDGELSYITATFPASWFAGRDARLTALMITWANRLAPRHGFGGLSFYVPPDRAALVRAEQALYGLARRFSGVELDNPVTQLPDLTTRLKGANWLTAVGDALVTELGGDAAFAARLPAGAELHRYSGGVVVQLGPAPQIGDTARGLVPASYAALSRVLRPVRVEPARRWGVSAESGYDREGTRALLARFDP